MGLRIKSDGDVDRGLVTPISEDKISNLIRIAKENPDTDVRLWIDSQRQTKEQTAWLNELTKQIETGNLSIQDLRTVKDYTTRDIFNLSETSNSWRMNKNSLIWRQVDMAKILICLQGEYDRVFYSDMDDILDIDSQEINKSMSENGFVVGGVFHEDKKPGIENQAFGFDKSRLADFRWLFDLTVRNALHGENGYLIFGEMVRRWVNGETERLAIHKEHAGLSAWHPDEKEEIGRGMANWR